MALNDVTVDIHEHGKMVDDAKKRAQCNYCGKVVSSGFTRLKFHLAGIQGDVSPCQQVPPSIKEAFRSKLLEKKKGSLSKEVGQLSHPSLPRKRNWSPQSDGNGISMNDNNAEQLSSSRVERKCMKKVQSTRVFSPYNKSVMSEATGRDTVEDSSTLETKKCISRFFYEEGIDVGAAESPSFQRMVDAIRRASDGESRKLIPSSEHLRGRLLKDEVKEMQIYAEKVRSSWANTGCSILLDGWADGDGRNLINIIVECPKGAIYLRSLDVSAALENADSLQVLLDQVIEEEVGAENVVQIVTCSTSTLMETLGKQFMNKHENMFWAVSASHCLELMLERMGELDFVRGIFKKAKIITQLIYNNSALLKLMRMYTESHDLVVSSKIRLVIPFLTLENIVSEEDRLRKMFSSSGWGCSIWASSVEGKKVADLVLSDHSFWDMATMVVRATIPIVNVMSLIYKGDKPQMGYIYETMDQAKETIKEELKKKKDHYIPFWEIIDDIWNNKLHSPLHSAGYFLNPVLFYSSDFFADSEVLAGVLCCTFRMTQSENIKDLATIQLDAYQEATGPFGEGRAPSRLTSVSPDIWWSNYGGQCPELQRLAIRILSQTCDGATKYQLKRCLAEQLLTNKGKRNAIEQQQLEDLAFVHYNMQLKNFQPGASMTAGAEIDPMSDWIVYDDDEAPAAAEDINVPSNEPSSWMDLVDSGNRMATTTPAIGTSTQEVVPRVTL